MDRETFSRGLAEARRHTGWCGVSVQNWEVQLLAMGWLWLAMTQIRPRHIASQIPSLWQRGVMNMSSVTACYGIMQHSYWFISFSQSHRFLTVNIYWWHSHESLILADPVSSNSVLSVLKVSCGAPLFAPVQLWARQCSLSICSLPNRNMGQFLHRFVTTRHWLCGIVNGQVTTFLGLMKHDILKCRFLTSKVQ